MYLFDIFNDFKDNGLIIIIIFFMFLIIHIYNDNKSSLSHNSNLITLRNGEKNESLFQYLYCSCTLDLLSLESYV